MESFASLSTICVSSSGNVTLSNLLPTVVEPHCITPTDRVKRPRSVDSFDMVSLFQATLPVDKSMGFPKIEWEFGASKSLQNVETAVLDTQESESDCTMPPPRKRRCGGMVRSRRIESGLNNLALLTPSQDEVAFPCERASSPTTCQELLVEERHQRPGEPWFVPLTGDLVCNDIKTLSF